MHCSKAVCVRAVKIWFVAISTDFLCDTYDSVWEQSRDEVSEGVSHKMYPEKFLLWIPWSVNVIYSLIALPTGSTGNSVFIGYAIIGSSIRDICPPLRDQSWKLTPSASMMLVLRTHNDRANGFTWECQIDAQPAYSPDLAANDDLTSTIVKKPLKMSLSVGRRWERQSSPLPRQSTTTTSEFPLANAVTVHRGDRTQWPIVTQKEKAIRLACRVQNRGEKRWNGGYVPRYLWVEVLIS
jgi:hypothetical protein